MNQIVNDKYTPVFTNTQARYFILMGGRSAGRSTVASQYALAKLVAPDYFRCAIMRLVLGDIRNSIYQDIADRIEEQELEEQIKTTENPLSIEYGQNKINGIGFRKSSGDQKSKLKSLANYNCVIIEEADEVSEEDFMQLDDSLRTLKSDIKIILLLNPPQKNHWIIKRWFNLEDSGIKGFYIPKLKSNIDDTVFIHSTFRDNIKNISPSTIRNFENYKEIKPDHYYNMIEGLVSEGARGRIFKNWKVISDEAYEAMPYSPYNGLDFGFTNDPTALIEIKEHNNKIFLKELIYETGLVNRDPENKVPSISQKMKEKGVKKETPTYADSAEPKSIAELKLDGWNIKPAEKGPDSVRARLDYLLGKEVYYTESSINIALEVQEYRWALDRNKEPTNQPVDEFNHAMDGTGYGVFTHNKKGNINIGIL